ncbi:nucleotidyltransferase family protein [Sphingomonas solaris]|uniref:Nucleotidyltransferase family protein n=1 Tax=Alterirhizorhabdus solaris TaxID=2529389 RepID=A0A558R0Z4_9SPHN|nr:nucleotidyltransferase family protein [Sphingomonas solaris]TVV73002.1 nucleotidyltransferase family protein [Sphingomonas solaris]
MSPTRLLVAVLADPQAAPALGPGAWQDVLTVARAELLIGSLAHRLHGLALPPAVRAILDDARTSAEHGRVQALWEAEMARRALVTLGVPVVLLKGTAFVAAGLAAGQGRSIGDLDILVPRDALDAVEAALLAAGWEWVKPDPYDHLYYRRWMHELPPLTHPERDRMIDVHHTILPLTARPTPDATALIADSVALENGLRVPSPADMIVHAAAHLFADGDLAGGLRNLWDIDRLVREHAGDAEFPAALAASARRHNLIPHVARALRLSAPIYATPMEGLPIGRARWADRLYARRLLARDGWGRETRPALRLAFYIRSHWIRMPPLLLARHLWTKFRRGQRGTTSSDRAS